MKTLTAMQWAVRELRRKNGGEAEAAVAERIGISRQALAKRLRARYVTTDTIRIVAHAFGLSPEELRKQVVRTYRECERQGWPVSGPPMIKDMTRAITPA